MYTRNLLLCVNTSHLQTQLTTAALIPERALDILKTGLCAY